VIYPLVDKQMPMAVNHHVTS